MRYGVKAAYTELQELFEITGPTVKDIRLIEDREKIRNTVVNVVFLLMYLSGEGVE